MDIGSFWGAVKGEFIPVSNNTPEDVDKKLYQEYLSEEQLEILKQKTDELYNNFTSSILASNDMKRNKEFWDITTNKCPHRNENDWNCPVKERIEQSQVWENCNLECEFDDNVGGMR